MKTKADDLQVIVLCGGKGERLRPLTTDLPKPLLAIKGKPILGHIIEHVQKYSFRDFIVAVGYKADQIRDYVEKQLSLRAVLVDSGNADIIRRIEACGAHIKGDFIVLYGDTLSDVDLDALVRFHRSRREPVTMTVWPLRSQFGLLEVAEDGRVLSFQEKPVLDRWINIGYFYFEKRALAWMRGFERFEDFLRHLVSEGRLNAFRHSGMHITVNTLKELEEAEENIGNFLGVHDGKK